MLLIDSGNSAIKTRQISDGDIQDRAFAIRSGFAGSGFPDYLASINVQQIYMASVAGESIQNAIRDLIEAHQRTAKFQQLKTLPELEGVTNAYAQYQQLGVDRWMTLLAAADMVPGDAIIIDAGSAITVDLLSARLGHQGGAILPGLNTDLRRFIELFPGVDFSAPEIEQTEMPGRSTAACVNIKYESVNGQVVDEITQSWLPLLEPPVEILLCGQDAQNIGQHLADSFRVVPDLVFIGMLKQIECLR